MAQFNDEQNDYDTYGEDVPQRESAHDGQRTEYRSIRLKKSEKGDLLRGYNFGEFVITKRVDGNTVAETAFTELQLVPLQINRGRSLQSKFVPGKKRVTFCSSDDRITPIEYGDFAAPKAADCNSCAYGDQAWDAFNQSKNPNDKPANPCEQNAEIVFVDFNDPNVIYTYRGERERYQFDDLRNSLIAEAKAAPGKFGRKPKIFEFVVKLTSGTNKKGQWVPKFQILGLMEEADVPTFEVLRNKHVENRATFRNKKLAEKSQLQDAAALNAVTQGGQQVVQTIQSGQRAVVVPSQRQVQTVRPADASVAQQGTQVAPTGVVRRTVTQTSPVATVAQTQTAAAPVDAIAALQAQLAALLAAQQGGNALAQQVAEVIATPRVQQVDPELTRAYSQEELRAAAGITTPQQVERSFTPPVTRRVPGAPVTRPAYVTPVTETVAVSQSLAEQVDYDYGQEITDDDIPF